MNKETKSSFIKIEFEILWKIGEKRAKKCGKFVL